MDNKTFLKEMAKHAQRNTSSTKREDSNQKKVQVKFIKEASIFDQIDVESLELRINFCLQITYQTGRVGVFFFIPSYIIGEGVLDYFL